MKNMFTMKVDSVIDVITNSSAELFTAMACSVQEARALISAAYPNFLDEYYEPVGIEDISVEDLNTYMEFLCSPHCWPATRDMYPVPGSFTFEELYTKDGDEPAWNGEFQYRLKDNGRYSFVTHDNLEWVKAKLDPGRSLVFMFSRDENPDYEKQEMLEGFMERIHLG